MNNNDSLYAKAAQEQIKEGLLNAEESQELLDWLNKYICQTCNKEKHDTAFRISGLDLDLTQCLDCEFPNRWDEAKAELNKLLQK